MQNTLAYINNPPYKHLRDPMVLLVSKYSKTNIIFFILTMGLNLIIQICSVVSIVCIYIYIYQFFQLHQIIFPFSILSHLKIPKTSLVALAQRLLLLDRIYTEPTVCSAFYNVEVDNTVTTQFNTGGKGGPPLEFTI